MTDQLLSILKVALLLVLYLFFARVLWAVWNEVRVPAMNRSSRPPDVTAQPPSGGISGAVKVDRPYRVTHMKVVAPAHLKGFTFTVNESGYTIGRSEDNDLALLRADVRTPAWLPLGGAADIKVGMPTFTVGYPAVGKLGGHHVSAQEGGLVGYLGSQTK